jgi:DNA mismatch endonuclease, patch repair protein
MTDIVDSKTRSRMMAGIQGKNTKPELIVRKYLHSKGFRYRLHDKKLPGSPDIVLRKYQLAIFVHGCFWHRHKGCKYATTPVQNRKKWLLKFRQNKERDQRQINQLIQTGWKVLVIWECGLRSPSQELAWIRLFAKSKLHSYLEWPLVVKKTKVNVKVAKRLS